MKITDPDIIKHGEKLLIESLTKVLDTEAVKELIKDKLSMSSISPQGGELIVHDNQIAFRMNFDLLLKGSLIFDRQGNYISDSLNTERSVSDTGNAGTGKATDPEPDPEPELSGAEISTSEISGSDISISDNNSSRTEDESANDDITDILRESQSYREKTKGL